MKIASFCIKHKVTTILAFVSMAVFGVVFYSNLKLALMPNMEFPAAYVMCTYAGAGPEDVEELVTRPLESCVSTLSGVDTISSTSSEKPELGRGHKDFKDANGKIWVTDTNGIIR